MIDAKLFTYKVAQPYFSYALKINFSKTLGKFLKVPLKIHVQMNRAKCSAIFSFAICRLNCSAIRFGVPVWRPFCSRRGKKNQMMSEVRTVECHVILHRANNIVSYQNMQFHKNNTSDKTEHVS